MALNETLFPGSERGQAELLEPSRNAQRGSAFHFVFHIIQPIPKEGCVLKAVETDVLTELDKPALFSDPKRCYLRIQGALEDDPMFSHKMEFAQTNGLTRMQLSGNVQGRLLVPFVHQGTFALDAPLIIFLRGFLPLQLLPLRK